MGVMQNQPLSKAQRLMGDTNTRTNRANWCQMFEAVCSNLPIYLMLRQPQTERLGAGMRTLRTFGGRHADRLVCRGRSIGLFMLSHPPREVSCFLFKTFINRKHTPLHTLLQEHPSYDCRYGLMCLLLRMLRKFIAHDKMSASPSL